MVPLESGHAPDSSHGSHFLGEPLHTPDQAARRLAAENALTSRQIAAPAERWGARAHSRRMRAKTPDLDEQLDRLEQHCPRSVAACLRWLRKPGLTWLRIPLGVLLIIGGVFSFLPVLGVWMLPLGIMLIALDVPFLRRPVARLIAWGEEKWQAWKRRRGAGVPRNRDQSFRS